MSIAIAGVRAGAVAIGASVLVAWLLLRGTSPTQTHVVDLPPWFGDPQAPSQIISGQVFGVSEAMTVHLLLDVPDPTMWKWREVRTTSGGAFDFGPVRAGRYRLFADGAQHLSRLVTVDTMRGHDGERVELFAHELGAIPTASEPTHGMRFKDFEWETAYRLSTEPLERYAAFGLPISGAIVRADGTPAAGVGVQPIECADGDHSLPRGMDVVATTSQGGGFSFVAYAPNPCGLRVLMGRTLHEVELELNHGPLLLIRLPPAGAEQTGLFDPDRRDQDDARTARIRGQVLRDGVPAGDVDIRAAVLPLGNIEVFDETRSRSDGSFELLVTSKELDDDPFVLVSAWHTVEGVAGRRVVRLAPGQTRGGFILDVGTGLKVSGSVVDERGLPIAGVRVGVHWWDPDAWSEPTASDGSFQLTIRRPGRYRLHAFLSQSRELVPGMGRRAPQIDINSPSGQQSGLILMFGQRERHVSDAADSTGLVGLGAEVRDGVVVAVRDELEAAGLAVGDQVLSATHSGVELRSYELRRLENVCWGEELKVSVKRRDHRVVIRATAPLFGPAL